VLSALVGDLGEATGGVRTAVERSGGSRKREFGKHILDLAFVLKEIIVIIEFQPRPYFRAKF